MNAYLFDVDGVLTNLQTRTITRSEIISTLVNMLNKGTPVGLISGRGIYWQIKQVVELIEKYVDNNPELNKTILDNLYVSGEFGGVFALHESGIRKISLNNDMTISADLKSKMKDLATKFEKYVYIEEKQTLFTIVGHQGLDEDVLTEQRQNIINAYQKLIEKYPELEVHADRFAFNIKHKIANKRYATEQFLKWIEEKGIQPSKYFAFGDSHSDVEMGFELYERNLPFEFIFVGDDHEIDKAQIPFPITITKNHCDAGTVEFLTK